jgi:uncharacterized protein (TIGR03382 family)
VLGKAAIAHGGWLEVRHDASLSPTNGITMEMSIQPAGDPDCDAANNFQVLLRKGEQYSLILEETRGIRARVRVAGGEVRDLYSGAELVADGTTWTKITAEYDAPTGRFQIRFDDTVVAEQVFGPADLEGTTDPLTIAGTGPKPACAEGGNFAGVIDEVSVSRIARHIQTPVDPTDPEMPDAGPGGGNPDPDAPATGGGGCCDSSGGTGSLVFGSLVLLVIRRRRRA